MNHNNMPTGANITQHEKDGYFKEADYIIDNEDSLMIEFDADQSEYSVLVMEYIHHHKLFGMSYFNCLKTAIYNDKTLRDAFDAYAHERYLGGRNDNG